MYDIYYILSSAILNISLASFFVILSIILITKIKTIFLDRIVGH